RPLTSVLSVSTPGKESAHHATTTRHGAPTPGMMVTHEPIGVVGVITAWNFPAYNPARAIASALAAGCTVVVRPSELTPLSAMAICAILVEAGAPAGAIDLVHGRPPAIGQAMPQHSQPRNSTRPAQP